MLTFLCLPALAACALPPPEVEPHQPLDDWNSARTGSTDSFQEDPQLPVALVSTEAARVVFELTNQTGEPLGFGSYAPDWLHVRKQYRLDRDWAWDSREWMPCLFGWDSFSLPPGAQAQFSVPRLSDAWCRAAITLRGETSGKEYRVASPEIAPWAPSMGR